MVAVPKPMNREEWGLLILLSVLWGAAFFFVGVAVRELPPMTVAFARVALATIVLWPLFRRFGLRFPDSARGWFPFVVMGILNNAVPFSLLVTGQTYITVGLTAIITAVTPLFTVVVTALAREEKLSLPRVLGVLLGIAGVSILSNGGDLEGDAQIIGIALCLAAALSYACAGLWARRYLRTVPPLKIATCQLICSSLIMLVVVGVVDQPWHLPMPGAATLLSLIGLAFLGTALAYVVFFRLLSLAGASNALLVTLLIPVTAMFLGAVFLDETVRAREIAGAGVIGAGLLFIDGRIVRWMRLKSRAAG